MASSSYGHWAEDDSGLPCFDLVPDAGADLDAPLTHLMSTGSVTAFVDRWGCVNLSTSIGGKGHFELLPNRWRCRSLVMPVVEIAGELHSLLPCDATTEKQARYGTGHAQFSGDYSLEAGHRLHVAMNLIAPWQQGNGIVAEVSFHNRGDAPTEGIWSIRSDLAPWSHEEDESESGKMLRLQPGLAAAPCAKTEAGFAALIGPEDWTAHRRFHTVRLERPRVLQPGESLTLRVWCGCLGSTDPNEIRKLLQEFDAKSERLEWAARLAPVVPPEVSGTARAEARWTMGQLLSFTSYDGSLKENYIALGGYAWHGFPIRECAETAMVISPWFPELALSNLRWLAKQQWSNGDMPKGHNFTKTSPVPSTEPHESDNEFWFIIGALEAVCNGLPDSALDVDLPWADGGSDTLWNHLIRAWKWIREDIGTGCHGVPKIWKGDWNDYLSSMGRKGAGESVMNAGLACRAAALLVERAALRQETSERIKSLVDDLARLREATMQAWVDTHFARGWTDDGSEVGGRDGRVFINAQSWTALGSVGTLAQRRTALLTALKTCFSPLGLTLCSRPFSCPPPPDISWCPIPAGEGENAGIWPQTVHWMIWALAECGLIEEAEKLWQRISLRNHFELYPEVPYGIFNGPDCYSSHHAGTREGRTQVVLIDRGASAPMNPAIAWQTFSLNRIWRAKKAQEA
jgi:hypothetical protein